MKKILSIASFILISLIAVRCGYTQANNNPFPKTISVNGSAEMEIVPDEIFVQVDLAEYIKKGSGKVELESIKKYFLESCKKIGLPDSLIGVASYEGYDRNIWWQYRKRKDPEMLATISYLVQFSSVKKIDELVDLLDDQATQNFFISKVSHSKIQEFRKQLKIQAIKAAKEKAGYLSESIGEKTGEAVTIDEPVEYQNDQEFRSQLLSNTMVRAKLDDRMNGNESNVDFKKIKLRYEVRTVFALK